MISISSDWIKWPNEDERAQHGQQMRREGFPGCVGFVGGTTLPLAFRPSLEGSCYYDRKKRYSATAQIICDMNGKIISLNTRYPGAAASDSTMFQSMERLQDPKRHFSPGEYLLANSANGASLKCIPAYKSPAADLPDNAAFNFHLACSRVRNEYCIGVLKGR